MISCVPLFRSVIIGTSRPVENRNDWKRPKVSRQSREVCKQNWKEFLIKKKCLPWLRQQGKRWKPLGGISGIIKTGIVKKRPSGGCAGPIPVGWNHRRSWVPYPGQYSTVSLRPRQPTTIWQQGRRLLTFKVRYRLQILTSYSACRPRRGMKTSFGHF